MELPEVLSLGIALLTVPMPDALLPLPCNMCMVILGACRESLLPLPCDAQVHMLRRRHE